VRMIAFDNPNHLVTKVGRSILLVFGFKKKLKSGCLISNKEVHLAQDYSYVMFMLQTKFQDKLQFTKRSL